MKAVFLYKDPQTQTSLRAPQKNRLNLADFPLAGALNIDYDFDTKFSICVNV